MSVRQSLLAILDQGPCYGYQLRTEHARRTGAAPLNVGQIYTTLERLERDGLVVRRGADERGHVYWGVTAAGSDEAARWFAEPELRSSRDDLAHKIALAVTLPGLDAAAVVERQRRAADARLAALAEAPSDTGVHERIVREADRAHARADLVWLAAVAETLADAPASGSFGLSTERPRRGRPLRADL